MLQLEKVTFAHNAETVIEYPDWQVQDKDHALILGNSGSGKTTLLHLIGGLMQPTKGILRLDNTDLATLSKGALDRFRGKNIGLVFQKPHLVRALTIRENLSLAQYLAGKKISHKAEDAVLEQLGILPLASRKVHQISQGQAQRVSIARAVINRPRLLLADEPTASLDDENCMRVIQLLKEQANETGATLLVATHDQRVKSEFQNKLVL